MSLLWLDPDLWSENCPRLLIDDLRHVNGCKYRHLAVFFFIAISAIREYVWPGGPLLILYQPLQLLTMLFKSLIILVRAETVMWKSCVLVDLPFGRNSRLPFFRISLLGPVEIWRDFSIFLFKNLCRRQVQLQILISASDWLLRFDFNAKIGGREALGRRA